MADAAVRRWQRECETAPSVAALEGLDAARRRAGDGPFLPTIALEWQTTATIVANAIYGWIWIRSLGREFTWEGSGAVEFEPYADPENEARVVIPHARGRSVYHDVMDELAALDALSKAQGMHFAFENAARLGLLDKPNDPPRPADPL